MAQQIEHILDSTETEILSVTTDPTMFGAAISVVGVWYNKAQLRQIMNALQRAIDYLNTSEV